MHARNITSLKQIQRCKKCGRSKLDDEPKCSHCGCAWPMPRGNGVNKKKPISITQTCKHCNNPAEINGLCEMHHDQQRQKNYTDKYREKYQHIFKKLFEEEKKENPGGFPKLIIIAAKATQIIREMKKMEKGENNAVDRVQGVWVIDW